MSRIVLLDAGPLGLVTNPNASEEAIRSREWLRDLLIAGTAVGLPEIVDYEVRRELLRANKNQGIRRLNELKGELYYLPVTIEAMLKAAEFWARARNEGRPTADSRTQPV